MASKKRAKTLPKKTTASRTKRPSRSDVSSSVYAPASGVIFRTSAEGNVVIIRLSVLDKYFEIDAWAAELWKRLDGKRSFGEIVLYLVKKSGADESLIEREALKVIKTLMAKKLIRLLSA